MKWPTYPARLRCDPLFTHRRSMAYCITTADCSSYYKYTRWCWMRIARASTVTHARLWWIPSSCRCSFSFTDRIWNWIWLSHSLDAGEMRMDRKSFVRSTKEAKEEEEMKRKYLFVLLFFCLFFFCMFFSSFSPSSRINTRRALAKSGTNETAPSPWLPALQGTPKDVRENDPFLISSAFNGCCCSSSGRLLTTEKGAS